MCNSVKVTLCITYNNNMVGREKLFLTFGSASVISE
jgi:hypothetical protein